MVIKILSLLKNALKKKYTSNPFHNSFTPNLMPLKLFYWNILNEVRHFANIKNPVNEKEVLTSLVFTFIWKTYRNKLCQPESGHIVYISWLHLWVLVVIKMMFIKLVLDKIKSGSRVVFLVYGTILQQWIPRLKNDTSAGKRKIIFTVEQSCQWLLNNQDCHHWIILPVTVEQLC